MTALVAAAAVWAAAVAGRWWGVAGVMGVVLLSGMGGALGVATGRQVATVVPLALMTVCGSWSGMASMSREAAVLAVESPSGPVDLAMRLSTDAHRSDHGWWALARADPPEVGRPEAAPMLLALEGDLAAMAGELVRVQGQRSSRVGRAGGEPYSGVVRVERWWRLDATQLPWWSAGNAVRRRALASLDDGGSGRALLAGFLVGETGRVSEADLEAMRRAGLSHLVAVSGSNVALFLLLTLVALGPLASGPRRRAVVGLAALVILVIATRWEASVVRASVMAALVLAGRVGGWALDAFSALSVTIVTVVLVSGELATDVGFALSVLATLGVVLGARLPLDGLPRPVATTLGASLGAQLAVAPLLLAVFGSVPLMAPITNLMAAPLVAASTTVGAIGVALGWGPLISVAAFGAGAVLAIARAASSWPQLGWVGTGVVLVACVAVLIRPRWRKAMALAGAVAIAAVVGGFGPGIDLPAVVVLDVGQGDAILIMGSDGTRILVDGGPDPSVLEAKLAAYDVKSLDLVVLTHVHADHATGLAAVMGRRPVARLWFPGEPHRTPASEHIANLAHQHGLALDSAPVGRVVQVGEIMLEVLAPLRRYASPNDQSTVMRVSVGRGPTVLLTGDIETYAQADLAGLTADVLKVPHQGAATSDPEWLSAVGAQRAVISVGLNDFGHPSPEIIAALEDSGAIVERTDQAGDIVIPLS